MSYYLGKVGRAGARLVHSCRELYNDVNAAYLTGAVDVLVVRQRDGSLKSTPFHARFGKLGVLRTGDFKEVEITLNGETVDLPMVIDESGKVFFAQPKPAQQTSTSMSEEELEHSSRTGSEQTESVASGNEMQGTRGNEIAGNLIEQHRDGKVDDDKMGGEGVSVSENDVVIDIDQLTIADESSLQNTSHDSHVTGTDHMNLDVESSPPKLEGTLILSPRRGSDTELEEERRECIHTGRSLTPGAVVIPDSTHPIPHVKSSPVTIIVPSGGEECSPPTTMFSSLPPDLGVLSDSALDDDRYQPPGVVTALSDTEVEVKDRLSSKLWEWSAGRQPPASTESERRSRARAANTLSTDEQSARDLSAATTGAHHGFWGALTGMLRRRHQRRYSVGEGIYLDDIDDESMDPEKLSQFFPHMSPPETGGSGGTADVTGGSSGLGSSPAPSPTHSLKTHQYRHGSNLDKLVSTLEGVTLSLCGGLNQGNISEEAFQNSRVSFADFNSNPELLMDPKLVVRVRGKYYPWQVAAPMIMSAIVFLHPLPDAAQSKLQKKYMPKKRQSFWSFWARKTASEDVDEPSPAQRKPARSEGGTPIGTPQKWDRGAEGSETEGGEGRHDQVLSSDEEAPVITVARPRQRSLKRRKCCLTNTPTSEQLASLSLKEGANEMVFSITTKFQGTTKAVCTVYLWDYHDKVVISDIDGTITRSDVAGQVLPLVGMDWTQNGVVELFNSVACNGYRVLYLSARAIGQAGYTKEFLRRVCRGGTALPDGPLFLTPSSLVTAFKKEVIEKRPYEFKIECLQQVRALFPDDYCPLHAGFGNRHSDVKSYTQVGVPRSRIFTVNHKGHLKYEISSTFQSSYLHLMDFVDAQFPPVGHTLCSASPHPISPPSPTSPPSPRHTREEYSTFNYWRDHIPDELPFNLDV